MSTPAQLLEEADRLAWLKSWVRAEPIFAEAERQFALRGDRRNELFARIGRLRGQLPRLPAPLVSQQLADYLDDPLVKNDLRLRLRCLVIKGETDEDIDPAAAERAWLEALDVAKQIGDSAWENRVRGELGIVAGLQGDINTSIVGIMSAVKVAESNGDVPSVVRWQTIFGRGLAEFGKPEQALAVFDQALAVAAKVPELQPPMMTLLAKGSTLAKLRRYAEAENCLRAALTAAEERGALGYQSELLLSLGVIAAQQNQPERALNLIDKASGLAHEAGANRILAEIDLEMSKVQFALHHRAEAERTLAAGVKLARAMNDRFYLPKLLARLAQVKADAGLHPQAEELLSEASDLLEGLFTKISSPWIRAQLIGVMDEVFTARIQLEGNMHAVPERMFAVIEQTRGRSLAELLLSPSDGRRKKSPELAAGERRIATLQRQLFTSMAPEQRRRVLEEILLTEARLSPLSTEFIMHARRGSNGKAGTLRALQNTLRPDEILLEFALAEPQSYCLVVTSTSARSRRLPGRSAIQTGAASLIGATQNNSQVHEKGAKLYELLLSGIDEIHSRRRLIVVPDGELHLLNFETLVAANGRSLLESHVVSYSPSGRVLQLIRSRASQPAPSSAALSISPADVAPSIAGMKSQPGTRMVTRGVYDLEPSTLPQLPSASDEARLVAISLGERQSELLLARDATEGALKNVDMSRFRVIHFATHGIVSSKYPERSALVLRPSGSEDGLFQAREILERRIAARLVTLSACETGSGKSLGQDGVSSLIRPFLAAGASTVVANLWSADDAFSLGLMRELYRRLGNGEDKGEALRGAKLDMLKRFGPQARPALWAGVVMYGDSVGDVIGSRRVAH